MIRAKFVVSSKKEWQGGFEIELYVVTEGTAEDKAFYTSTPSGNVRIATVGKNVADQFEIGKKYYVDFTKAE